MSIWLRSVFLNNQTQKTACTLLAGFFLFLLTQTAYTAPMRVVYGFDREFPPFSYEEAGGKATGFDIELVQAVFANADVTLVMRPLQWELIPLELSSGTVLVTTGMVKTEQRERLFSFSDLPTFKLPVRLFTKVYKRYPSLAMFRGQSVSVEEGSYQHRLLEQFGGINIKTYKDRVAGLQALYNDEVEAYCGLMPNTYYYINKLNYGAITTVGSPLGVVPMNIAVNKNRGDVLRLVNDGLAKVIASGEYDRIYRKWFVRELTDQEAEIMIKSAVQSRTPAYAPYTQNSQGAAVLTVTGKIYTGCTVENADPGLTVSALESAIARCIAEGEYEFRAAVIVDSLGNVVTFSQDDLQSIYEFGRGTLVLSPAENGGYSTAMVGQLLPAPVTRDILPLQPQNK